MDLAAHLRALASREHLSMRELRPLSGLGPDAYDALWETWQRIPVRRRTEIAHAMVELAEDNIDLDFTMMFRWLLDDADPEVRASAGDGLSSSRLTMGSQRGNIERPMATSALSRIN